MRQQFNTITLPEHIPKARVKTLRCASDDIVAQDEKKKLALYLKQHDGKNFSIDYQYPQFKPTGRVRPVPYTGLGTFCQEVRGYLANGIYIDVDMVNCHPVIIRHLLVQRDFNTSNTIDDYIFKRSEFLEKHRLDKEEFLKSLYKSDYDTLNQTHKRIHNQIYKDLIPKLLEENSQVNDILKRARSYNKMGQFFSHYVQEIENQLLSYCYSFFNTKGISVDVLMHDGFFVRLTDETKEKQVTSFFPELKEFLLEATGYSMEFKVKPHNLSIKLEEKNYPAYADLKKEFEETHSKIISLGLFARKKDTGVELLNKGVINTSYEHKHIETGVFIKEWFQDENMLCYDDIGNYPNESKCPANVLNTWTPFAFQNDDEYEPKYEELETLLNHIKILCGNDEKVYDYFCRWIAHMIQFPEYKSTCITLISEQGAGKGTLMKLLQRMLGSHKVFETTSPSRDVWGDFNSIMMDCFLVNLNEMGKSEIHGFDNRFKALVTDESLTINGKGIKQFSISSYHRFLITTNNEEPMKTSKSDRRNVIVRSSDEKVRDIEYFTELNELIADDDVVKTCFEYFRKLKVNQNFYAYEMPKTEYHESLKELGENILITWLRDFANTESQSQFELKLTPNETYQAFKKFLEDNAITYEVSLPVFTNRLDRLQLKSLTKKKSNGIRYRYFNICELRKELREK